MYVKAVCGDGEFDLFEAGTQVSFSTTGVAIPPEGDHSFLEDERFPQTGRLHVRELDSLEPVEGPGGLSRIVRWVRWAQDGHTHLVVTGRPVYILNDQGDTVEALHSTRPEG